MARGSKNLFSWRWSCCTGRTGHSKSMEAVEGLREVSRGVKFYSYKELKSATMSFHVDKKIGTGGFGSVYKGVLKDGTMIAVKQLSAESNQGIREFVTEIALISSLKHDNLVKLLGCCIEQNQRILVYSYLENNSIAQALLGSEMPIIDFDWATRAKICIGIARGLAYIHEEVEPPIVHRDIKASNILLDKDLNPRISDFGLGKLFPDNVTHISTRVAGTIGYLAPEYALRGQLTKKADIYSLGVLLLEIVSGRNNTNSSLPAEDQFLLEKVWRCYEENHLPEIMDPRLRGMYNEEEAIRIITVALLCTQAAASCRPSMNDIVSMLCRKKPLPTKKPSRPGFISDLRELKMRTPAEVAKTHSKPPTPLFSHSTAATSSPSTIFTSFDKSH